MSVDNIPNPTSFRVLEQCPAAVVAQLRVDPREVSVEVLSRAGSRPWYQLPPPIGCRNGWTGDAIAYHLSDTVVHYPVAGTAKYQVRIRHKTSQLKVELDFKFRPSRLSRVLGGQAVDLCLHVTAIGGVTGQSSYMAIVSGDVVTLKTQTFEAMWAQLASELQRPTIVAGEFASVLSAPWVLAFAS